MARTIDNLGIEISSRYAEDRAIYDENLIKDSAYIPAQTKIAVTLPYYPSEFDTLFHLDETRVSWAIFRAPPHYFASRRRLFSESLIPQLGSLEKQESQIERIKAFGDSKEETLSQQKENIEMEKQTLLSLFANLGIFDQLLIDINSRRSQYQKG